MNPKIRKIWLLGLLKKIQNYLGRQIEKIESRNLQPAMSFRPGFWQKEIRPPQTLSFILGAVLCLPFIYSPFQYSWFNIFIGALIIGLIWLVGIILLKFISPAVLTDREQVLLVNFLLVLAAILNALKQQYGYNLGLIALPTVTFLSVILLGPPPAISITIIAAIILSLASLNYLSEILPQILLALWLIRLGDRVRHRQEIVRIGFLLAAGYFLILSLLQLLYQSWQPADFLHLIIQSLVNGFLVALVVLTLTPYLEIFFSRLTDIKLLELADFNQPLLRRLMLEAPGTYHHSLLVASLAESAARSIGARDLLARVGAYYHDIGKLTKPEYFIENQSGDNPHAQVNPEISTTVITAHIREGVKLAQQYKLPSPLIDFIQQHHGTSLIRYFYHRALESEGNISEEKYRYSGPRPTTRETAIVLLADSIEAASRTLPETNASQLKNLVEDIINNKFIDGQLADSPLTLNDIKKIARAFMEVLAGIFHTRIDYEEKPPAD